jgi:AraC-like DNA-binding protein
VKESESIQLGPGKSEYVSRRVCGRDLIVLSYRVAPKLAVHTVPRKDWAVLVMSLNPRSDLVFNGRVAQPFDLFLSVGADGYMTTGRDRRGVAIAVRKTRLISACAALAGVGAEDVRLRDLVLAREQDSDQRLRRALICAAAPAGDEPLSPGEFAMLEAVENDLVFLLAERLVPTVCRCPDASPFRMDALRVVRAAAAVSKALPAPGLAELCEASGVGQRWLHKSFVDVLGVSPYRYIRLARLSKARELLLSPAAKPVAVKSVSLSVGYRLSGRFASDYRLLFGENPSDTLRGSRKA